MIDLKSITIEDRDWIKEILDKCDYMSSEYSFGNNFIWRNSYDIKVANVDGFYVAALENEKGFSFLYPAGKGDIKPVIEKLLEYCAHN